jgi:hypothetical protein
LCIFENQILSMKKILLFVFVMALSFMGQSQIVINEIDPDQAGTDTLEFVELYGPANTALDGYVMVFFNGGSAATTYTDAMTYAVYDLDGYTIPASGYFVLGNPSVANVNYIVPVAPSGFFQNGPDAVALYLGNGTDWVIGTTLATNVNLIDAIVYSTADPAATGLLTALAPTQTQVDETAGNSATCLARVPDGGTALVWTTYVEQLPTPGATNGGAVSVAGCMDATACNYNALATTDDGSCFYVGGTCDDGNATTIDDAYDANCTCQGVTLIPGCMDASACNYNASANLDDASCILVGDPCDDLNAGTTDDMIQNDCTCAGVVSLVGCTDATACNYNPNAVTDDGSCLFPGDICDDGNANTTNDMFDTNCLCSGTSVGVAGCMDITACNYNINATVNDGSCYSTGDPCDDGNANTVNDTYDISCQCGGVSTIGCMDITACNFNSLAIVDDGSCVYPGDVCDDGNATTTNDMYDANCICSGTSVGIAGCTDNTACNYDVTATMDDGSCTFPGDLCNDNNANTINDVLDVNCVCVGTPIGGCGIAITLDTLANLTCFGIPTGYIGVQVQGGQGPYYAQWNTSPIQTTPFAHSLPAGTYTLTITDALGCIQTFTQSVTQPTGSLPQITGTIDVAPGDTATYCVNPMAGASYTWDVTGGTVLVNSDTCVSVVWDQVNTGNVTVIQSSGACDWTDSQNTWVIAGVDEASIEFNLYPNPTSGHVWIETTDLDPTSTFQVLDLMGRKVFSGKLSNYKQEIDLTSLADGQYVVMVSNEHQVKSTRLMILGNH